MIVAAYRVKNEGRWIAESLMRSLAVADRAVVFDDHSEDGTSKIASGFRNVEVIESPFDGFDEARDRGFLLRHCIGLGARWVISLDGDEVLTPSAIREIRSFSRGSGDRLALRIAYLWNRTDQERCDGLYDRFMQIIFWSVFNQPELLAKKIEFKKGTTDNRHCGRSPRNHRGKTIRGTSTVKHYGYLYPVDRRKKYEQKSKADPRGNARGWYGHMVEKKTVYAPGAVQFRPCADR